MAIITAADVKAHLNILHDDDDTHDDRRDTVFCVGRGQWAACLYLLNRRWLDARAQG